MTSFAIDTAAIAPAWKAFQVSLPVKIGTITSEREFKRVVKLMNGLLDVVGDDEDHELAGLLDVVGQFVEEYETRITPCLTLPRTTCCGSCWTSTG